MYLVALHHCDSTLPVLECNERCETSSGRRVKLHQKRTKRLIKLLLSTLWMIWLLASCLYKIYFDT